MENRRLYVIEHNRYAGCDSYENRVIGIRESFELAEKAADDYVRYLANGAVKIHKRIDVGSKGDYASWRLVNDTISVSPISLDDTLDFYHH